MNVHEAKTQLSRLIEAAEEGEEVVIARAGTPVVRLVAIETEKEARRLGPWAGRFVVPSDFDSPLPDDVVDGFEGKADAAAD